MKIQHHEPQLLCDTPDCQALATTETGILGRDLCEDCAARLLVEIDLVHVAGTRVAIVDLAPAP